jgi:hypothetical protein
VAEKDPEPEPYDAARAAEIAGAYENDAMTFTITTDSTSLSLDVLIRPVTGVDMAGRLFNRVSSRG